MSRVPLKESRLISAWCVRVDYQKLNPELKENERIKTLDGETGEVADMFKESVKDYKYKKLIRDCGETIGDAEKFLRLEQ